ncbi:MAG: complex I subunit 4 family protein, partial [Candidatus Wenzhouxiangella sp. M2_3B_020]
ASGAFYAALMFAIAGVLGVFLAVDLFLFFLFWELMLVPMYFLIAQWGHGDSKRSSRQSAIKFFIYTQASGLLMLLAIVALVWLHFDATGEWTFALDALRGAAPGGTTGIWLLLGFVVAFAVKLPAVPVHGWLPDAHTDAPTGGSVILAGILLKTGAYGLLRFGLPLFPEAAVAIAPYMMWLGVVAVLYGAWLAFAQTDFKRLVAYSSIAHMGFVLIGVFALNVQAWQGAVMQMVAHGLSTAALFVIAGLLQQRIHTRDMNETGGLWKHMPVLGGFTLLFVVASIGMPGLANFIGEFLVLVGAYRVDTAVAAVAALGLVLAAVYGLALVQRSFHGPLQIPDSARSAADATRDERALLGALALFVVVLGVQPGLLFDVLAPWLNGLAETFDATLQTTGGGP